MVTVEQVKAVYQSAELLADKMQVMAGFDQMAVAMTEVLADQNPLLLCVMNGGLMTMSELMLRLDFPLQCDYVHVSRYHGETSGQASVHWKKTPSFDLKGRVVVIVDDVLD